ncbi:MAG: DUF2007 domain-containing protein [Deltaproteobacteria bacterium]|nr:DUF2007 domain-containing protein [Deltaproteobacteria bacterium]
MNEWEMMKENLVTISTHGTIMEAEIEKSLLESEGIEGFIRNLYANALYPGLLGEVELQVREEDVEKALDVLGS